MKQRGYAIYIHIPFCVQKCLYCDFLSVPWNETKARDYLNDLILEIDQADWSRVKDITSVYIGGGTPSLIPVEEIKRILAALRAKRPFTFGCEISMEANPGTVDLAQLKALRAMGVNRISLGAQSFQPEILKKLGRIHDEKAIIETAKNVVKAGYENWNLDLMFDLPGQSVKDVEESLQQAIDLNPSHISFYSLIIEPGTPFYEEHEADRLPMATEEGNRIFYHAGRKLMQEKGYQQYEISNFAKPGRACRQNLAYWRRKPYLGFGLGAASFEEECRYVNPRDFSVYRERIAKGETVRELEECMDSEAALAEAIILGLRMNSGLSLARLKKKYPQGWDRVEGVIQEQVEKELLIQQHGRIQLSERGMDLANQVMMEFL